MHPRVSTIELSAGKVPSCPGDYEVAGNLDES